MKQKVPGERQRRKRERMINGNRKIQRNMKIVFKFFFTWKKL